MNDDMELYRELDELPSREASRRHTGRKGCGCRWCIEKRGDDYPWHRVNRWLRASEGQKWNDVIADFVRLEWVPARYRTYSKLCEHVEVNTFIRDCKVWYYSTYGGGNPTLIDELWGDTFFVYPVSEILRYKRKTPKTDWGKFERERRAAFMRVLGDYHQLLKLDGIWYEVKGDPNHINCNRKKYGPKDAMMWSPSNNKKDYEYLTHRWERPRIVLKRQLSGEELKKNKLTNEC